MGWLPESHDVLFAWTGWDYFNNLYINLYDNNLDQLLTFASMTTTVLDSQLNISRFLSLLIRLSVYQTQASLLGILINFVNDFCFN